MKHRYLIVSLNRNYSTEETHSLANAIMELNKVIGVEAAYNYQIAKKNRRKKSPKSNPISEQGTEEVG